MGFCQVCGADVLIPIVKLWICGATFVCLAIREFADPDSSFNDWIIVLWGCCPWQEPTLLCVQVYLLLKDQGLKQCVHLAGFQLFGFSALYCKDTFLKPSLPSNYCCLMPHTNPLMLTFCAHKQATCACPHVIFPHTHIKGHDVNVTEEFADPSYFLDIRLCSNNHLMKWRCLITGTG